MGFLFLPPAPSGVNNHTPMGVSPGGSAARRLACLLQVLAVLLILCGQAQARSARIALTVNGDEGMSEDLKQLVEEFQKNQPLQGDALALLQGAQAALARGNTALRSRGSMTPAPPPPSTTAPSANRPRWTPSMPIPRPRRFPSPSPSIPARASRWTASRSAARPRPRCLPST